MALVAPSGPAPASSLQACTDYLRRIGLDPVALPSCTAAHHWNSYLSGDDALRADDLTGAWLDPQYQAVICVRGGYGAIRVLDLLDVEALRAAPGKPLYGSSDVTALHEFWQEQLGVATWFTPMPATAALYDDQVAQHWFEQALFTPWQGRDFAIGDTSVLVPGAASGRLVGGNLSLLAMTLGVTQSIDQGLGGRRFEPNSQVVPRPDFTTEPKIAIFEDVDEDPYKVDGFFMSLLRAGWFTGVQAIVLGSFTGERADPAAVGQLANEFFGQWQIPVVAGLDIGHCSGAVSLPLGVQGQLVADEGVQLIARPG